MAASNDERETRADFAERYKSRASIEVLEKSTRLPHVSGS
jgi:hypothetical protein